MKTMKAVLLDRVTADQHTVLYIKNRNASRRMPRDMNNLQRSFSQIQFIAVFQKIHFAKADCIGRKSRE